VTCSGRVVTAADNATVVTDGAITITNAFITYLLTYSPAATAVLLYAQDSQGRIIPAMLF